MTGETECAAGVRCALVDVARRCGPGLAHGDAPLCPACLRRAGADIAALPGDHAALGAELIPAGTGLHRWVSCGADDAGAPLTLDVEALQRDILWTLTVWEPPVREAAGLPRERVGAVRASWVVREAAGVLAPRVDLLSGLGPTWGYADGLDAGPVVRDGLYAVESLRTLHRRARAVCGVVRRVWDLPGECSRCGANALTRADGADIVRCNRCRQTWTYANYRRYVGLILTEVEK